MAISELPARAATVSPSAVIWVDEDGAIVARASAHGAISTCEIHRGREPEPSYVSMVARATGDRERVVILGPGKLRLATEREYVATYGRSGRLLIVERAEFADRESVVERLRTLVANP